MEWKEYRLSRDVKTPVLYLSDAVILNTSQITVLEQFLTDSEKIPKKDLHTLRSFWKTEKEKLRREDADGITGVICYMKEEDMPQTGSLVMVREVGALLPMPPIRERSTRPIIMRCRGSRDG